MTDNPFLQNIDEALGATKQTHTSAGRLDRELRLAAAQLPTSGVTNSTHALDFSSGPAGVTAQLQRVAAGADVDSRFMNTAKVDQVKSSATGEPQQMQKLNGLFGQLGQSMSVPSKVDALRDRLMPDPDVRRFSDLQSVLAANAGAEAGKIDRGPATNKGDGGKVKDNSESGNIRISGDLTLKADGLAHVEAQGDGGAPGGDQ